MANKKNIINICLAVVSTCFIVMLLVGIDRGLGVLLRKSLDQKNSITYNKGLQRFIRLREVRPFFNADLIPSKDYLHNKDSIARQYFHFETDPNGFIKPSAVHVSSDVKIVFLGGSTTECKYITEKNRFPYLVGRLLEESTGKKINSYNGGASGNHSLHSFNILLNKVLPLNPDVVVMMHAINDLSILLYEQTYWNKNLSRSLIIQNQLKRNNDYFNWLYKLKSIFFPNIYELIRNTPIIKRLKKSTKIDEFEHIRSQPLFIHQTKMANEFKKSLLLFIHTCKTYGITPVLMTQENRFIETPDPNILNEINIKLNPFGISYFQYKALNDLFNKKIREVALEQQITIIDLDKQIPKTATYMMDIVHFSEQGSILAAKIIAKEISSIKF